MCDAGGMGDILSVRVSAAEKQEWQRAAAAVQEPVAEFVRKAVRQRAQSSRSPWDKYLGAAKATVSPPTNENIRLAMRKRTKAKP
jgi:hypothetical protein